MDGELVNSCLVPVCHADGSTLTTIEGISQGPELHAVQRSFLNLGGAQCGICTPGMILAALCLLRNHPHPSIDEVKEGLSGNLCRCTGYQAIFAAVIEAAAQLEAGES